MKTLEEWLIDQNLQYKFLDINLFEIPNIGKFAFIGTDHEIIFDQDFNLIAYPEHDFDSYDFIVYEFGGNYFYTKSTETENINLKLLKYLGEVKTDNDYIYTNLGVRGSYELLNGSGLYSNYVKKAKFMKQDCLGICELNTLAGALVFQTACKDGEIKFIIGETVTVKLATNIHRNVKLYVQSENGWRNLLRINTFINVFNLEEGKFITIEQLKQHSEDLICVLETDFDFFYLSQIKFFKHLYFQIDTVEYKSSRREIEHLEQLKNYFEKYSIKVEPIVICESFYVDKDHSKIKKILNKLGDVKFQNESNNQHFKTIDEITDFTEVIKKEDYIKVFWKGIENTNELASLCDFEIDIKTMKLPKYPLKESEQHFENAENLFNFLIEEGFNEKIKGKVEDEKIYRDRIESEVIIIKAGGFIDYFLILWDIMIYCKENNILTGIGRGSAGGSLISYLFSIIHLDPIQYDLLFERFLNEGRFDSVPDIDCDFEQGRRDDVKRYMEERFGIHHVASIGTYTTTKLKGGIKDIGRMMDYDHKELNIITSMITSDFGSDDEIITIFKNAQTNPKIKEFVKANVELINTVMILLKNSRSSSIHASGVIVVPKFDKDNNPMEIYDWLPVRKTSSGELIAEWEGYYLDKAKFVKEDILGLQQLDKFSYILQLIKEHTGKVIDIHKDIPIDDAKTYEMFSKGFTDDVFQFGSDPQKGYSLQVKPDNIEHLTAMNALYRPGPMESNAHIDFFKIKNGDKEPIYDKGLEHITGATYGLWVYQEQLMLAYRFVTNSSLKEADDFRKILTKKKAKVDVELYYNNFINGYIQTCDVTEEEANVVWDKIISFISYGFNKCFCSDEVIFKPFEKDLDLSRKNGTNWDNKKAFYTIGEMFNDKKVLNSRNKIGFSLNEKDVLVKNRIVDIRFEGIKPIYRLTTECNKTIDVTLTHKFPTSNGEKMLCEIDIEKDKIYVDSSRISSSYFLYEFGINTKLVKIKSIEFLKEGEVYDVEMEAPYHSLLTQNGIVASNSHAAAYAITGYYSQYLKVHYPLQFWCTALEFTKEEEIHKRISEINRSGQQITLSPPDVNNSEYKFYANKDNKAIYWSLTKIKFCGEKAVDVIIQDRQTNGHYFSFEEFISRVPKKTVNSRTVTYMILAGCFDEIENIQRVEDRIKLIQLHSKICKHKINETFLQPNIKQDYWWLLKQKEVCGFGYIHFDKILRKRGYDGTYKNEIEFFQYSSNGKEVIFAGIIIQMVKRKKKTGEPFCELRCEVNSELIYVTIWSGEYHNYKDVLDKCKGKIILMERVEISFSRFKNVNVIMTNNNSSLEIFEI